MVFTLTASTGEQLAAESPDWGHGVFTRCLLDALEGKERGAGSREQGAVVGSPSRCAPSSPPPSPSTRSYPT